MKKFVVPIIIAAALGVGGGVTAILMNRPAVADTNKSTAIPVVKTGNYYLNGNKDSGMYFELTDKYIALRVESDSESLEQFKNAMKPYEGDISDELLTSRAKDLRADYCAENPYVISIFGTERIPYQIMIHWNEKDTGPTYSGTAYNYNGIDKIHCSPIGDFILV